MEKPNSERVPRVESKRKAAKDGYTALNEELTQDLNVVANNTSTILDHLLALVASFSSTFSLIDFLGRAYRN